MGNSNQKKGKSDNEKFVDSIKRGKFSNMKLPDAGLSYLRLPSGSEYFFEPKEDYIVTGIRSFT